MTVARNGATSDDPILIELGKHKKKRIRELLRGEGRLLNEVTDRLQDLKASGTLPPDVKPVIVVVREKTRPTRGLWGGRL